MRFLRRSDVPSSRMFTMADILRDPHYAARQAIVQASGGDLGSVAVSAPVPKLSATPGRVVHAGGEIGADSISVLTKFAGIAPAEAEAMLDVGIVFDASHARARSAAASEAKAVAGATADPT